MIVLSFLDKQRDNLPKILNAINPVTNKNKATLIGLIAIFLWTSMVGIIKIVSEKFGAIDGSALI